MKSQTKIRQCACNSSCYSFSRSLCLLLLVVGMGTRLMAAGDYLIYSNNFEAYIDVATNLADTANANPTGVEMTMVDDNPVGGVNSSGVQIVNWLANSGSKSLLLRSGTELQIQFRESRSGSGFQLDFWMNVVKGAGNRSFYVILRGMGSDVNSGDYLAYRSDRGTNATTFYYDGVGPSAAAWAATGGRHTEAQWQHHRIVFDTRAQKFNLYVDDMNTPVVTQGDLSNVEVPMPTQILIRHEGDSSDDGYFAIDDLTFTALGATDLATTFTDGFESYTSAAASGDDADPLGAWITVEADGTGAGKSVAPAKVQVVNTNTVTPHSGKQCLKMEGGQRAGVTFAWGVAPQTDVQITWWARVPASVKGTTATYLRMSLYGVESGSAYAGDSALLGYGSRDTTVGDETSLTYYTTKWVDTTYDYTPNTWEEYRLITHNSQGRYTIIKNPSSMNPQIVVDREAFVGSGTNWGPTFMVAWSSSNGSGHPPVYVDDIEVKSLVSNPDPLPEPYGVTYNADRFTNSTIIKFPGSVGGVAVDPRDNSTIVFTVDAASPAGGIYSAHKVASGNWVVDSQPIVTGLDRPSGIAVAQDGTIWWTHDYTASLMRLRAPWQTNSPEQIIANFGPTSGDDDTIDVTIAPATFSGSMGRSNMVIVLDRGCDADASNTVFYVDPATTLQGQTLYQDYLVPPTATLLGVSNVNAIAPLPQSGEVVTINEDGSVIAIDGNGTLRKIVPMTLYSVPGPMFPTAVAVDPATGRIWIADDALDQVWSIGSELDPFDRLPDRLEMSFPLSNPSRPERQIDMHEPGLAFSPDGSILVLADSSTTDGSGRLIIFHNEKLGLPDFKITKVAKGAQGVQLEWQSAGNVNYEVQRATNAGPSSAYQSIAPSQKGTQYTDTNAPAGKAFYRIQAKP